MHLYTSFQTVYTIFYIWPLPFADMVVGSSDVGTGLHVGVAFSTNTGPLPWMCLPACTRKPLCKDSFLLGMVTKMAGFTPKSVLRGLGLPCVSSAFPEIRGVDSLALSRLLGLLCGVSMVKNHCKNNFPLLKKKQYPRKWLTFIEHILCARR